MHVFAATATLENVKSDYANSISDRRRFVDPPIRRIDKRTFSLHNRRSITIFGAMQPSVFREPLRSDPCSYFPACLNHENARTARKLAAFFLKF